MLTLLFYILFVHLSLGCLYCRSFTLNYNLSILHFRFLSLCSHLTN